MSRDIVIQAMTAEVFAPFGDMLDCAAEVDKVINQGQCGRYHDCARLDFWCGRSGISLFNVNPRELPLLLDMVERHPDGSQAFLQLAFVPFLVVVAPDDGRRPGTPLAFRASPGQAINYHKGTWHGILTPPQTPGLFAVVDRIGASENLEKHWFSESYRILDVVPPRRDSLKSISLCAGAPCWSLLKLLKLLSCFSEFPKNNVLLVFQNANRRHYAG